MTPVLAIDPGTTQSQCVLFDGRSVVTKRFEANDVLLGELPVLLRISQPRVCIEGVASYGMPVGKEVFDTCIWIGRFFQVCVSCSVTPEIIYRKDVKLHLCGTPRAKDGNIRQAIIDRFGGKDLAIGRKGVPGPLYGIASHAWAALALALYFADTRKEITS